MEAIFKDKEEARWFETNIVKYEENDDERPINFIASCEPIGEMKGDYEFLFTVKKIEKLIELIKEK